MQRDCHYATLPTRWQSQCAVGRDSGLLAGVRGHGHRRAVQRGLSRPCAPACRRAAGRAGGGGGCGGQGRRGGVKRPFAFPIRSIR